MRFSTKFVVLVVATCLAVPALAEEAAQEVRQQIEAVHMKWLEALNKGDVETVATVYTPASVQIDAFGRTLGVNPEFVQGLRKKGITLAMPIDSIQALKGGEAAIAYGTFTSKYTDPNTPPGQGNWMQVFERDGQGWKIVAHASSRAALALNK
jgi:ketosteroid isomerase-like protein